MADFGGMQDGERSQLSDVSLRLVCPKVGGNDEHNLTWDFSSWIPSS